MTENQSNTVFVGGISWKVGNFLQYKLYYIKKILLLFLNFLGQ